MYDAGLKDKTQFIQDGRLNMELVLEKFVTHFDDLYGDQDKTFYEDDGRTAVAGLSFIISSGQRLYAQLQF